MIIKSKRSYLRRFFQENNSVNNVWDKVNEIIYNRTLLYQKMTLFLQIKG